LERGLESSCWCELMETGAKYTISVEITEEGL
jgi:hypothetical protein